MEDMEPVYDAEIAPLMTRIISDAYRVVYAGWGVHPQMMAFTISHGKAE